MLVVTISIVEGHWSMCLVMVVLCRCFLYASLESNVSLSILGFIFMGSMMVLFICSNSCVLYSSGLV